MLVAACSVMEDFCDEEVEDSRQSLLCFHHLLGSAGGGGGGGASGDTEFHVAFYGQRVHFYRAPLDFKAGI